jgi:hypothetical protein
MLKSREEIVIVTFRRFRSWRCHQVAHSQNGVACGDGGYWRKLNSLGVPSRAWQYHACGVALAGRQEMNENSVSRGGSGGPQIVKLIGGDISDSPCRYRAGLREQSLKCARGSRS